MMNLPLFFSDLDHTLIFSRRALQRYKNATVGTVVVEDFLNEPLSYMDMDVWKYLASESGVEYQFIPTTTRTVKQYERVLFPSPPELAIVQNGAKILIEGEEDVVWSSKVKDTISQLTVSPAEIHEQLMKRFARTSLKTYGIKSITNVDDTFVYIVGITENMWKVDSYAQALAEEAGYILSKQGRKIYLIPPCVSKDLAVQEIIERKNPPLTFAAGDSILDSSMAQRVDHFFLPKHGDTWSREESIHETEFTGLESSKEILETLWGLL